MYLIVEDGIITNIIQADEEFAGSIGALPYYDGARIGEAYQTPEPEAEPVPEATQLDRIEAQITYTAMMTGTLLEDDVYEEEN